VGFFPEYERTAGFPPQHIEAFKMVSRRNRMVIASRELNPLCTDLLLEGYAAKGFHIKAKTCDWGPMAGFVPVDHRFTKAGQGLEQQRSAVAAALAHNARRVPLAISTDRLNKLRSRNAFTVIEDNGHNITVAASPGANSAQYRFVLTRRSDNYWTICYAKDHMPDYGNIAAPTINGLVPVEGLGNPTAAATTGVKSAVCGDYDLWCVFPHASLNAPGINDRPMSLRAKVVGRAAHNYGGKVASLAQKARLVFTNSDQCAAMAADREDKHLGNISLAINRIRRELNAACRPGLGDVSMHSDYGGNPYGTVDYPLIFFIPKTDSGFAAVEHIVVRDPLELKSTLAYVRSLHYRVELNPAWTIPNVFRRGEIAALKARASGYAASVLAWLYPIWECIGDVV
jgi:hypothetical protein